MGWLLTPYPSLFLGLRWYFLSIFVTLITQISKSDYQELFS